MPVIGADTVPDPQRTGPTPSVERLTARLRELAILASVSREDLTVRTVTERLLSPNASDDSEMRAGIWFGRASERLKEIFASDRICTNVTEANDWWKELQRKLYCWLTLKYNVLKHANKTGHVLAVDIAREVVSVQVTYRVRHLWLTILILHKYQIDIDAVTKYLSRVSQPVKRAQQVALTHSPSMSRLHHTRHCGEVGQLLTWDVLSTST